MMIHRQQTEQVVVALRDRLPDGVHNDPARLKLLVIASECRFL